jgi:hypothetical protein
MSFMSIHVNSCKFMSIYVNSCHSFVMSFDIGLFRKFSKVGEGGGGDQICLPRPSATAPLSGRRQKWSNTYMYLHFSGGEEHCICELRNSPFSRLRLYQKSQFFLLMFVFGHLFTLSFGCLGWLNGHSHLASFSLPPSLPSLYASTPFSFPAIFTVSPRSRKANSEVASRLGLTYVV